MNGARFAWPAARDDVAGSFAQRWLWAGLAWHDLRMRYRGTVIGPLWITLNLALLTGALTLVFGRRLADGPHYAAWVACGLVLWQFLQTTLSEACHAFLAASETIRNVPMPLSAHLLRIVTRNALVLAHNLLLAALFLLVIGPRPGLTALAALPGILALLVAAAAAALVLAVLGARFRDVGQIVTNALQLLFFLTPIVWTPERGVTIEAWLVRANPVAPLIEAVRGPLIGRPDAQALVAASVEAALLAVAAFVLLAATRRRVAYWV